MYSSTYVQYLKESYACQLTNVIEVQLCVAVVAAAVDLLLLLLLLFLLLLLLGLQRPSHDCGRKGSEKKGN